VRFRIKVETSVLPCILFLGISLSATAQQAQSTSTSVAGRKPNIVFILVDNVGWSNFQVYGGTVPTPRIDKLASEGIRFNNYNVEVQCTPSRSAIMTGRHPVRSGTYSVPLPGEGKAGMAPWEYTIAKLLSDTGYATALYGKWHLGNVQGRLPNDQGFDEWWGIENSWDESGYTAWPQFKETGVPVPMIWEGKKGEPSKPVMPLDLNVRPIVDEKYIIPKTIDYIPAMQSAYIKPQFPMMYDLSSDPHEDSNLFYTDLTNGALMAPALKTIAEYERSVRQYPNIKVGGDFNGYKK
jgi:arylsulfatase